MNNREFLIEIRYVLREVSALLEQRRSGSRGMGTITQLESIQNELTTAAQRMAQGQLPPPDQRDLISAWIVTDAWPVTEPLGERICRLAYWYRQGVSEN